MNIEEMRAQLAAQYWDYRKLLTTVDTVLRHLYRDWAELPEEVQAEVNRLRMTAATAAGNSSISGPERCQILSGFLDELAAIDAVLPLIFEAMLAGKTEQADYPEKGYSYIQSVNLLRVMRDDPSKYVHRSAKNPVITPPEIPRGGLQEPSRGLPGSDSGAEGKSADGAGEDSGGTDPTVQFFTYVDFPQSIPNKTDQKHPLVVQLTLNRPETSRVEGTANIPFQEEMEFVDVVVRAPGFVEASGYGPGASDGPALRRTIAIYQTQNSQPAVFLLQLADERTGPRWIIIDFYHRDRNVGSFTLEVSVSAFRGIRTATRGGRTAAAASAAEADAPVTLGTANVIRAVDGVNIPSGEPVPPADVELRVIRDADGRTLHFHLKSKKLPEFDDRAVGSIVFNDLSQPSAFFARLVERLSVFAARASGDMGTAEATRLEDEIADIGIELYEQLFPDELRAAYWRMKELREAGELKNLLIVSDEPWIPWELVRPYDEGENEDLEDDHLAGAWQMSRWLAGVGVPPGLNIQAAHLIAPILDLEFVQEEMAYFDSLAERNIQVAEPIATRQEFLDLVQSGGAQLFHFATHGDFNEQIADESPITLQDEPLFPSDLNKRRAKGLRRDKPLFFLNTCHGAQVGFNLTGLGGWAQRMVDQLGVTAFVGALWEVNDELASKFAQTFYEGLWAGQTLGEAFFAARQHIREIQSANPTWIAYTLYGDPNSRIAWKAVSEVEPAPEEV